MVHTRGIRLRLPTLNWLEIVCFVIRSSWTSKRKFPCSEESRLLFTVQEYSYGIVDAFLSIPWMIILNCLATKMPLELREVRYANEFPEIMDCYFTVFEEQQSKFLPIYAPKLGTNSCAREDAIKQYTARMWFWHAIDPNSTWIKVVDTDMGEKVIAAAKWNVYKTDPFTEAQSPSVAFWWPHGEGRRYAEMALNNIAAARVRRKPHACNET